MGESIPSAKSITLYIHDGRKYLQSSITFYARFVLYAYSSTDKKQGANFL
jgi:hypothetical protein